MKGTYIFFWSITMTLLLVLNKRVDHTLDVHGTLVCVCVCVFFSG